jgi:hypothetical protein
MLYKSVLRLQGRETPFQFEGEKVCPNNDNNNSNNNNNNNDNNNNNAGCYTRIPLICGLVLLLISL